MIVYNITFHIEKEVLEEGLIYLKETYIPNVANSGFLHSPLLRRVMLMNENEEGESYAVQFHVKNLDTLNDWMEREGSAIYQTLAECFGHKMIGFATLLEEIDWTK